MMCAQLANDVAISAAAACNGLKQEYSYVLQNMGFPEQRAASSVRLCFGRDNTEEEALIAVDKIVNVFKKLNSF